MHLLGLIASLILTSASPAARSDTVPAQSSTATIVGVVTDSSGRAIPLADVSVDGIRLTPTDDFGSFIVNLTAGRQHIISVRALGFLPAEFSMLANPGDTRTAQIPLASVANLLPGVRITVHQDEVDKLSPGLAGFGHRRETLGGSFLNSQEIKEAGYPPLSMLLRQMPGVAISYTHENGMTQGAVSMRGSGCVQVYLDGMPEMLPDSNIDNYINTHELAAIEVYPSSGWVPVQFMASIAASCGTIVLWTADGLTH